MGLDSGIILTRKKAYAYYDHSRGYSNFTIDHYRNIAAGKEQKSVSKNMILSQSGTAMLAQANQRGQAVLQLLQ